MRTIANRSLTSPNSGTIVLHFVANSTSNTETINIVGNNSVSNVALNSEIVTAANITKVYYGVANGDLYWTVERGSNTVLVLNNSGFEDFETYGNSLSLDNTANLTIKLNGNNPLGYMILELRKITV